MLGRKSAANINPSEKSHSYHRVSVQQSDRGLQLMTLPSPGTVHCWSGSSGEGDSSQGTGGQRYNCFIRIKSGNLSRCGLFRRLMVFIIHDRSTKTRNEISSLKLRKKYYWASPALLHIWLGNYIKRIYLSSTPLPSCPHLISLVVVSI